MDNASRDQNFVTTLLAVSSVDGVTPVTLYANPTTHRLLVDLAGGGSGTVQTVAVATANGFAGTSDGNASAPTITLTTSVTGVLYGNGTAMSALTIGTGLDLTGSTLSATGSGTGDVTAASNFGTDNVLIKSDGTSKGVQSTGISVADSTNDITGAGNFSGTGVTLSGLTASEIVLTDASKNLVSAAVATYPSLTELTYLKGVTSGIQSQINGKQATGNYITALTGDVTATGPGSVAATIANSAVTLAKMANLAQDQFIGRVTASTGVPETATITAAARTVLDDTTVSDMVNTLGGATSTGTGGLARETSPTFVTPTLGVASATSLTTTGSIELGNASDTTLSRSTAGVLAVEGVVIPSISSTNTLTNKRITKRTGTTTSSATPTINTDTVDYYSITAQTEAITSFTTNLSGTPTTAQQLRIDVTGTAARAITWGASFANGPVALPTTTVTTTRLYVLLEYDGTIWRCMASGSTV